MRKNTTRQDKSPIEQEKKGRLKPADTPESRENQLIAAAYNLSYERMLNGTATSQEIVHFLKLGSTKEKKERELLDGQIDLMNAKREQIQSQQRSEELMREAIAAFTTYLPTEG